MGMEFKGTKGIWTLEFNGYYHEVKISSDSTMGNISSFLYYSKDKDIEDISLSDECKANAIIVSKAPELFDMLRRLYNDPECFQDISSHGYGKMIETLLRESSEI